MMNKENKDAYGEQYYAESGAKYPAFWSKLRGPHGHRLLIIAIAVVTALSALGLVAYSVMCAREQQELRALAEAASQTVSTTAAVETMPAVTEPAETVPEETEPKTILPQYAQMYEENQDLYGWLKIEGTQIDYPVMYATEEPEKYLHANFKGEYSFAGLPFLDTKCSADSDNLLIYAHNVLDGSMFRSLLKYEDESYWKEHPVISLHTLYEEQEFEVLAAFYDRVYYKTEEVFKFYQFIDAADEAEYNNAIAQFREKSLYDTGVEAKPGDQLVSLVTCAYHVDNGRFVVVARKTAG
jgi:sortase B